MDFGLGLLQPSLSRVENVQKREASDSGHLGVVLRIRIILCAR